MPIPDVAASPADHCPTCGTDWRHPHAVDCTEHRICTKADCDQSAAFTLCPEHQQALLSEYWGVYS